MAHNRSPRVERPAVLASPLGLYTGHVLHADCGTRACGGERLLLIDQLVRDYGGAVPMAVLIERLRCPACRAAPRRVVIRRPVLDGRISPMDKWLTLKGWEVD